MSNPIQQLNQILGKTEPNESRESKTQKERKKERNRNSLCEGPTLKHKQESGNL